MSLLGQRRAFRGNSGRAQRPSVKCVETRESGWVSRGNRAGSPRMSFPTLRTESWVLPTPGQTTPVLSTCPTHKRGISNGGNRAALPAEAMPFRREK